MPTPSIRCGFLADRSHRPPRRRRSPCRRLPRIPTGYRPPTPYRVFRQVEALCELAARERRVRQHFADGLKEEVVPAQSAILGSGEARVSPQTAATTIPLNAGSRLSPFLAFLVAATGALVVLFCSCFYFCQRGPSLAEILRPGKQVFDLSRRKVGDPIEEMTECVRADLRGLF